ncbi:MAG: phosphatidylserine/phosphatidylglycerophosphate/cardiolipin synthase family protein [Treponema sp.]|nr:phosphatidylserine/phosphatidylglycerophosphate/cardiolipin synthase family protein [Treponema sp.]
MNITNNKRKCTEKLDLRGREVGCPVWSPNINSGGSRQECLVKVYQSGPQRRCINDIITAIGQAQQTVMLISFLIADAEFEKTLLDAADRGVRVYILTAAANKLEKEPEKDSEFERHVLEQHKCMLNKLAGKMLLRSAEYFHAKLILIDALQDDARGFILTANLTKEALERNEELAVELNKNEIISAFEHLRWAFWEAARHELQHPGRLSPINSLGKSPEPRVGQGFLATMPDNQLLTALKKIICNAERRLIICSFGWDANHILVELLLKRILEGLQVTVLCRIRPKNMPAMIDLSEAGATVLGFPLLHAKAVWNDKNEAIVMSANFEDESFSKSLEYGVILQDERAGNIGNIMAEWEKHAPYRLFHKPKLGDLPANEVIIWKNNNLEKKKILNCYPVDLGEVFAGLSDNLQTTRPEDKNA